MMNDALSPLEIDLEGLNIEDIEIFFQEGSRGMPPFAASCNPSDCFHVNCACSSGPSGS